MAEHKTLESAAGTNQDLPATQADNTFPGYRRCLCCFIDVLGFRELVVASSQDDEAKRKLHMILRQFQRNYGHKGVPGDRKSKEPPLIVRAFSDSIVRIIPLGSPGEPLTDEDLESEIIHELIDLCGAQFDLLTLGILVRGGLAIGDIYWDDHQIFGPALINAYDLENQVAVYPRIVLDNVINDHIRNDKVGFLSPSYRRKDSDGTWFVDYLGFYSAMLAPNIVFNKKSFHKPFEAFRSHIVHSLTNSHPGRIKDKHMWLARYFNSVVAAVPPDFAEQWHHLLITI